jgi:hypothetical protein
MKKSLVLALMAIGSPLWAANYYVDFILGNDANSGMSAILDWKHSPGDDNAQGLAKSAVLHAGDTVFFKGGCVYAGMITAKWSGASNQPIVYDGNTAGAFGSGRAIIDGENTRTNGFYSSLPGLQQISIRNFELRNFAADPSDKFRGSSAVSFAACNYLTVANCYIHDLGIWSNDGSKALAGCGVYMISPRYCLVTHCEITKTGSGGIALNGAQNCVVSHNNIHDYVSWAIDFAGDYAVPTHNVISRNTIHDLYYYDKGFWGAAGDPPHDDYIFIRQGGGSKPVSNIVEGNLCYNNYSFAESGGTAMTFLSNADSTIIRDNVYINPHSYYTVLTDWGCKGTQFYNNTIYAPRSSGFHLGQVSGCTILNNIVVCGDAGTLDDAVDTVGLRCDYNFYYTAGGGYAYDCSSPSKSWTFAQWQGVGYDTHGKKIAAIADYRFAAVTGYPLSCQTMDLHLLPGSPVIDAGLDLSAIFSCDRDSVARPQGAGWDIGAYEFKNISTMLLPHGREKPSPGFSVNGVGAQGFSILVPQRGNYVLSVYAVSGKKIWSKTGFAPSAGNYTVGLDLSTANKLANGTYMVSLGFQKKEVKSTFIVRR